MDAAKREASRSVPVPLNYASSRAPVVSRGTFDQHPGESCPGDAAAGPVPAGQAPGTLPSEGRCRYPRQIMVRHRRKVAVRHRRNLRLFSRR